MPTARRATFCAVLLLVAAAGAVAQPWPSSGLAIRTNGATFRPGGCLRVTLLALDGVPGPLQPRVAYRFQESITVTRPDGQSRTFVQPRALERPADVPLEYLEAGTSIVLDDTFCFGSASLPGAYEVTVTLGWGGRDTGTLTTCVEFQREEPIGPVDLGGGAQATVSAAGRCSFALRGVSRRDEENVLTLEGEFPSTGLFRLAFLRGDRLVSLLDSGVVASAPGEVSLVLPPLGQDGEGVVDLLLQDQLGSRSAVLADVALRR